jgi:uncharacterized RDD family membrane protein YckC
MSDARGIVTPEAVRLDFAPAGIGSRALALLIDLMALVAVQLVVGVAMLLTRAWLTPVTAISIAGFVLLAYPVVFEVAWRGRTPGKAALGLRVTTVEGAPVGLRHAVIRAAFALVDVYATVGAVAVLSALVTRRNQRLGDLVAGTLVLRERSADAQPEPLRVAVPAGWEAYAAALDPAALSRRDYEVVRSFLLRAGDLDPGARERLARRLADPLADRLGHRPPPGVSAELFLVCLAGRYQQRAGRPAATAAARPGAPPLPPPPGRAT